MARKEKEERPIDNVELKKIITCLMDEPQWLELLKGRGKPYEALLDFFITASKVKRNEDNRVVKRIAEKLGEKPAKLYKWIRQIYVDIMELNEKEPELFFKDGEIPCTIIIEGVNIHEYVVFNMGLPYLPRINEDLDIFFLSAYFYTSDFYVSDITHRHVHGKMSTDIHCSLRFMKNKYRDLLYDKALFVGDLNFTAFFGNKYGLQNWLKEYARDQDHPKPTGETNYYRRKGRY